MGCQEASKLSDQACAMRSGRPSRADGRPVDAVAMVREIGEYRGIGADDALGLTGRAGGEDDVGAVLGMTAHRRSGGRQSRNTLGHGGFVEHQRGQPAGQFRVVGLR